MLQKQIGIICTGHVANNRSPLHSPESHQLLVAIQKRFAKFCAELKSFAQKIIILQKNICIRGTINAVHVAFKRILSLSPESLQRQADFQKRFAKFSAELKSFPQKISILLK